MLTPTTAAAAADAAHDAIHHNLQFFLVGSLLFLVILSAACWYFGRD